jgi:hypothetical protein
VADVNGDGALDILAAGQGLVVLFGVGNGSFHAPVTYSTSGDTYKIRVADLNNDGLPDVALLASDVVTVFLNTGSGLPDSVFSSAVDYPEIGIVDSLFTLDLVTLDLDGDGWIDIGVADAELPGVRILMNLGNGTFAPSVSYPGVPLPSAWSSPTGSESEAHIAVGDFNGDGLPDVALSSGAIGNPASPYPPYCPCPPPPWFVTSILLNRGDGTLSPPLQYGGRSTRALLVADVDGDGKDDLLTDLTYSGLSLGLNHGCAGPP